jgi:hypothetical protein
MAVEAYGQFIKEAFIDPIRSVLIIDDKYPTLEQVLKGQISGAAPKSYEKPEGILSVINGFRNERPALIVDVHNGELDVSEQLAKHLHQSDLLILDYELNDSGEKAVDIVKNVFENDHFNLIVVHTSSEPLDPFKRILLSFLTQCPFSEKDLETIKNGKNFIDEKSDEDPTIAGKIKESVTLSQYIAFRHPTNNNSFQNVRSGQAPFTEFHTIIESNGWKRQIPNEVFLWAISEFEKQNTDFFGKEIVSNINWSNDFADDSLWVRTNKGFITFVQKHEEVKLLDELLKALINWGPNPSRLLSAKLRAVIDNKGVIAEDLALNDRLIHAKFYQHLYADQEAVSRRSKTDAQITRKIEHLANVIQDEVAEFIKKVVEQDRSDESQTSLYQALYGVDINNPTTQNLSVKKFNAYVSCYPRVAGWHLAPGHVLEINGESWVCLSPICDLVPSQKSHGIYGEVGNKKPFVAVKIFEITSSLTPIQINSNSFIFIPDTDGSGNIKQYRFNEVDSAPHWSLMLAGNKGIFDTNAEGVITLDISKFGVQQESNSDLVVNSWKSHITAQLRYEYALNLMHKLGGEFTRIGLDYISH